MKNMAWHVASSASPHKLIGNFAIKVHANLNFYHTNHSYRKIKSKKLSHIIAIMLYGNSSQQDGSHIKIMKQ